MVLSAIAVAVPARAADNPNIVITDLTLTRTNNQGTGDWPGKLTVGQHARLDFKWDASNADVKAGDSFTIDLGTYFENLEYPKTVPMTVTNNGEQIEIGSCDLTHTQVVCTFSDKVDELKAAGFDAFRGTGAARLRAIKATTSETADITTNNVVSVDLPETGGIGEAVGEAYRIYNFHKWAGGLWSEKGMTWGIDFGTKYVGEKTGTTLDGSRQTIVMTDNLGEGMEFRAGDYLKDWVLYYRGTNGDATMQQTRLTDASGADAATGMGDFDLSVEVNGRTATITATGPFKPDSNYQVTFPVTFSGGKVTRGVIYGNSATLNGTAVQAQDSRYFVESFSITVEMAAGFGGFDITKVVSGTGAASVPAGTEFTVDVSYELPAVASTYEGWTAPGTLNADGKTGTAQMKAVVGQKVPFNGTFPKGTKITLAEDPSTSTYTALGWSDPSFVIGGRATNTLTIGDQTSVAVTLTNTTAPQGTFAIKKLVSGADDAASKQFTFDYECSDGQSGAVNVPGDGTAVTVDKSFPLNTTCTIVENSDSAQVDGYTLSAPESQTVTISDASNPIEVSFTNSYTRDRGSFSVKKVVRGDYTASPNETFTVNYRCDDADATSGSLSVPADGTAVSVDGLPAGTNCVIGEDADSAQRSGYALAVDYSATNLDIEKDTTQDVTVTNDYTRLVGGFTIAKTVDGDGADRAPVSFEFDYSCVDESGKGTVSGTLTVAAGASESVTSVPTGSCTVTEKEAPVTNAQLATKLTVDGTVVDGSVATINVGDGSAIAIEATNTYTLDRGSFSVAKAVTGDYNAAGESFTVNYTCDDADATSGSLSVPADGTAVTVDGLPVGTSCTVTEDAESSQRDGYALATSYSSTTVAIEKDTAAEVTVTNEYTRLVGGFTVAKTVEGDGADLAPSSFDFDYACVDAAGTETVSGTLTVEAGSSASVADVPTGSCTITEKDAAVANTQLETTLMVDGEAVDGDTATIEIGDGSAIAVAATNTYTLDRGSFSVAKKVSGADAAKSKNFTFAYECSDGSTGSLTVPGDGTAVEVGKAFPLGTTCEVSEDASAAQLDGYTLTAPDAQKVSIEEKDKVVELSFTNTYTENTPPPSPSKTPTPGVTKKVVKKSLPLTGADLRAPGVIAVLAIAAGGLALWARRRKA
jgi:hypothetical protein